MKDDIYTARQKTREAVAQITCWCLVIALRQTQGIGPCRQDRVADAVDKLQRRYARIVNDEGRVRAVERLRRELAGSFGALDTDGGLAALLEMRVPLNRAPRTRREEQIAQAGNEAATFAWLIFALAVRQTLRFGRERLEALHHETVENYRQFNGWARLDEREAWEKLRYCAEQAIGEEIVVVDEDNKSMDPLQFAVSAQGVRQDTVREAVRQTQNARARAGANVPPLAVLSHATRRAAMEEAGIVMPGKDASE